MFLNQTAKITYLHRFGQVEHDFLCSINIEKSMAFMFFVKDPIDILNLPNLAIFSTDF